ncbi:hypothetical protein ELH93_22260 [Rhizobium leguminosarum]|uniref:Integral membrane protein n=1 Tax=Rhizobium leguminosarum TaxID=384 RepID=A0ABD7PYX1_RHILE|nr:hypothetical protein [Rhizobium leguminosarum]TAW32064.1 hypothetical protein ELI19_22260 [Rhizobium leguminosarum]TAW45795.1 hypothetical protein ELI18_22230 [Rhizobium leguminosarum]TAY35175.1 hypothetical protein ELH93_22260 [Rhizobium leguminosarum]
MTKRLSTICLVAFFLCFLGGFVIHRQGSPGVFKYIEYILAAAAMALFPFSVGSYMATHSWRELRKDRAKREFILKHPLRFLIWREARDEADGVEKREE